MRIKTIPVARAASLVIFISAVGSFFAVLREALTADRLGVSVDTDAYFFSFTLIVSLPYFMMEAIKKSLAPVYIHGDEQTNSSLVNSIMTLHLIFYSCLAILVVVIIHLFPQYFLSGFDQDGRSLVLKMVVILAPTIPALGLWGMNRILLEAEGMFVAAAVSDAFLSLFVIASILLIMPYWGVYSLPVGVVLSTFAQLLWVSFWLWRAGVRFHLGLDFHHLGLRRFFTLFWPPLIAAFFGYSLPIIDREMASHLGQGTISSLSYADKIVLNLRGILIIPLNNVLLPSLARQWKGLGITAFKESITQTLGVLIFLFIPASLFLSVLNTPTIQLFYQRGKFDAAATANTASIYKWLVLCLMPMACSMILETVFSSMQDTKTAAFVGVGSKYVSKVILNIVLIALFGAVGLGMASPLMYLASGGLLFAILWKRMDGFDGKRLVFTLLKTLAASLLAVLPISLLVSQFGFSEQIRVGVLIFLGPLVFLALAALFQIPELQLGWAYLVKAKQHLVKRFAVSQIRG